MSTRLQHDFPTDSAGIEQLVTLAEVRIPMEATLPQHHGSKTQASSA